MLPSPASTRRAFFAPADSLEWTSTGRLRRSLKSNDNFGRSTCSAGPLSSRWQRHHELHWAKWIHGTPLQESVTTMKPPVIFRHAAIFACGLSGCALWTSAPLATTSSAEPPVQVVLHEFRPHVHAIEWNQLTPGQYCELITSVPPDDVRQSAGPEVTKIAGLVTAVDETSVTLTEAISIDLRQLAHHRAPMIQRVPYVSRLFKNTGILIPPTPIPGELRVLRTSIRGASRIDSAGWPGIRRGEFERIGIDFDMEEGEVSASR